MYNPFAAGRPSYLPIHYGRLATATTPARVLCASADKSTPIGEWPVVNCLDCLRIGAERGSPTARARLTAALAEAAQESA